MEDIRESDGIGAVVNIDISHYQAQNGAVESRLREQNARLVASSAREPLQQMRNDGLTTLELLAFEGQHADILEEAKKCLPICIEKVVEVGAKRLSNFVVTGHFSKRLQERSNAKKKVHVFAKFVPFFIQKKSERDCQDRWFADFGRNMRTRFSAELLFHIAC